MNYYQKIFITLIITLVLFAIYGGKIMAVQQEELLVLSGWMRWTDAPNMLYKHLSVQAIRQLDERTSKVATLKTAGQWLKRQDEVRHILSEIVGPFPEKTPLNSKVVGVIQREGFRVEKIVYESMPDFYVPACLFIPDGLKSKTPAILYLCGHTEDGFRSSAYQTVMLNLVKKGFVVMTIDPIGQGERLQYFDKEKGKSSVGGPTAEHSYVGAQCFLSGKSFARYRIWDGIRAIDYLLTRSEVDPQRIGATGRSGGGTLSAYVAAFDDRVLAVAPENYITNFKRLLESSGPQDAEQNFYHGIARGIDHADFLEVRTPKPALLITTTRDMFSIQGARETAEEVKIAYKAFGKEGNFEMVEDDAPHTSTLKNREAMYAFFQKHLNLPGSYKDEKVELFKPEELKVTDTGQVSTSLGGRTVFNINQSETEILLRNLEQSRLNLPRHLQSVKSSAKKLAGYIRPNITPQTAFMGRLHREGYSIEKYVLQGESECAIPVLLMLPDDGKRHPALIYIHPEGKIAGASEGGEMEFFVKKGFAVLAPDMVGIGETGPGGFKGDSYIGNISYNIWFEAILNARSIVGIHAGDIVRLVRYLESRKDIQSDKISAIARGGMCSALLHAMAFEESIGKIALIEPIISYSSIVMNNRYNTRIIPSLVPGALTAYDLPDIIACIAPRKLLMINITDQMGNYVTQDLIEQNLTVARSAYSAANANTELEIVGWNSEKTMDEIFSSWLSK